MMRITNLEKEALRKHKVNAEHKANQIATCEVERDVKFEDSLYRNLKKAERMEKTIKMREREIERLKELLKKERKKNFFKPLKADIENNEASLSHCNRIMNYLKENKGTPNKIRKNCSMKTRETKLILNFLLKYRLIELKDGVFTLK